MDAAPDVVVDGHAYYVAAGTLNAIDLASGDTAWTKSDALGAGAFAGIRDDVLGLLLCGVQFGSPPVHRCLRASDGTELWAKTSSVAFGSRADVRLLGGRLHILRDGGGYGGVHAIHDLADGTLVLEVASADSASGLVEAGNDVLVPGEYTNNGGIRSAFIARDTATGTERARFETFGHRVSHIRTDAQGVLLRLYDSTSASFKWQRYSAGTFTDVTSSYTALEAALGPSVTLQHMAAYAGPAAAQGKHWLFATTDVSSPGMLCRLGDDSVDFCAANGRSAHWQAAPNAIVGAGSFRFDLYDIDTGSEVNFGQDVRPVLMFERWTWGESGRWYGGD